MTVHKLIVQNDRIFPAKIEVGTEGSFGTEFIEPSFSDEWDGLSIKAVFHPRRGKPVEMLWRGTEIEVPAEIMKYCGDGQMIFSGYRLAESASGEIIFPKIKTLPCVLNVPHTLTDKGVNAVPETPGVYEQLREGVKEDLANGIIEALQKAKDSGDFKGDKGDKGDKGEQGVQGEQGTPGVYVLEDGETLEDVPEWADVVVAPYDDKSITILDRGIVSVTRTEGDGSPGTYDTYTILFSDDSVTTFQIYNGANGKDGTKGENGKDGKDGKSFAILGYYDTLDALQTAVPTPEVGDTYGIGTASPYDVYVYDGVNGTWVNNGSLSGVKGEKGEKGDKGDKGDPGKDGTNGTNGKDGTNGTDGKSVEMQYSGSSVQWRYVGDTAWNTLFTVGDTVAEGGTAPVTGGAVYTYVNGLIGDFLNGES